MNTPWQNSSSLPEKTFKELRREVIFECCKWDPQVGDTSVLCPTPLVLAADEWKNLSIKAGRLAAETLAAEQELQNRPELHRELGFGGELKKLLGSGNRQPSQDEHPRLMRFDFHFTTEGWKISEVNSDVPGGFNEASGFCSLMAGQYPGLRAAGDPAGELASALIASTKKASPVVALVHATAYTDDRQVMTYLGRELTARGARPVLLGPDHIQWLDGIPAAKTEWSDDALDAVFRFFPAEWLPNLPSSCKWQYYFRGSRVPLCNPGTSLLTQSKRFPLIWDRLQTSLPRWRSLLPETHPPGPDFKPGQPEWVFKPALGRVGDSIGMTGVTTDKEWRAIRSSLWWHKRHWIVQKRFETIPVEMDHGPVYPCLGIYTINGRASGAYARVSRHPLINHLAMDAAVLVQPEAVVQPHPSENLLNVAA